jgi:hypothetical protein
VTVIGPAWNTHGRETSGGRFPLQVEQAVANPVGRLVPGVTTVTTHARYYTLHGLLAYQASEENLTTPEAQNLLRRCEVVMGAASLVDEGSKASLYGRPHGFAAMQQVIDGGDLDVDEVSRRDAYSTSDWGFRGPYLGAERILGIVARGSTWKPGKRYDNNAVRLALEPLSELAAQPTVTCAQLRQIAPQVSIYQCDLAPDGIWLAELLCGAETAQDRRRRKTLQLVARVIDTRQVESLNASLLGAVAFGDFITTDQVASRSDESAMWRGVLLRNFSVGAWRRLWAWLVDQVHYGVATSDSALEDRFAEQLPAGTVDELLNELPTLVDTAGNPLPIEQKIRADDSLTEANRELNILACGALRSEQLEGITRTVFTRHTGDDLDPVWMRERLRHSGPQSVRDFGRELVRDVLAKSRRVSLSKAEVRNDGTLWIPSRLHQRGEALVAPTREGRDDVGNRLPQLASIAAACGIFDRSGQAWQLTDRGRMLLD